MAPETPRGVSSRLLTMKFMQRAAASASSAGSPDSTTPSSKKRKLDHSPAEGRINLNIDQASIQAALDEQEATRQAALKKHSTEDTQWVLNTSLGGSKKSKAAATPFNIVYVGYGGVDSASNSDDDEPTEIGRTTTKGYKAAPEKTSKQKESESSEESSDDEDDARPGRKRSQGGQGAASSERSRSRSKSRKSASSSIANELRNKRKQKEVSLNKLTSISSAGSTPRSSSNSKDVTCYKCQQQGHRMQDCPTINSAKRSKRS
ncbi:hypothetical protein B0I35DRAFT_39950 [Stachybotrys elegans]|uniref:CCHC-type domain-containing protein n=1 Tax=Stachybotrys elegans TaxID=80388 RepID=A0A8K0T6Y9_9HYPO|nr:hypothetical protein B0I35DRAFT_39950 [Stachybotrys elegans]